MIIIEEKFVIFQVNRPGLGYGAAQKSWGSVPRRAIPAFKEHFRQFQNDLRKWDDGVSLQIYPPD